MKNLAWKKIALGIIAIAVVVSGIFYFTSVKGTETPTTYVNPAFGEYISSYTAGVISSGSVLRIQLAQDAVDSTLIGQESSVSLFNLSPSSGGKAVWVDKRTVEFRPDKRLLSGRVYEVKFALAKLIQDVPSELKTFEYTFQVIPLNFEVSIENVKPYVKTELKRQRIEGSLLTSDFAENDAVEKMLSAEQGGKALKVTWTHVAEGKQHSFIVEDISRGDEPSKVNLVADGKALDIDQVDSREIEIPALGDFKVTNVRVEQSSNQNIVIQFSDPLNEKQNVAGLITVSDLSSLDFEIRDNEIRVYPPVRQNGSRTLTVEAGIRNVLDYKLKEGGTFEVVFEQLNPAVRFVGEGNILPGSEGLALPFEAVNLRSVDVKVVKVFESNILQFLQVNQLDGAGELRRVGKPVLKKTISLDNSGVTDLGRWNRFSLDLSSLIAVEPGAIYQVGISFKRSYVVYGCEESGSTENPVDETFVTDEEWTGSAENESSYWDSYEEYYYGEDYDWEQRDNPCHSSYYRGDRSIKRNVLASDLGLIVKRGGDGNSIVFVNDLKTTQPLSGVTVEIYDYQQQLVGTASTGTDGRAIISSKESPFALIARSGSQRGYLRLFDGEAKSISNFDVGGERVVKGLKGFLYGERGVWCPGDSLYMTFLLEDKLKLLPANHPVVFELQDPKGQVVNRLVRSSGENGFYKFATTTSPDAPTGNWTGRVKVGGTEFTQPVKIEMVKPNRLKINLDFGVEKITASDNNVSGTLQVNWLHGAPGRNLNAQFEVLMTKAETKFQKYPDYVFEDPSREFYSEAQTIFDAYTDDEGKATINATLNASESAPGMLNAVFRGKVFEESGNFSIDRFSLPFFPYESFTGLRLPPGDKARGMLLTDTTHTVDVVTVDADGNGVSRDNIQMSISKLRWRWWWDSSEEEAVYMSGSDASLISSGEIETRNGKGSWKFKIKYPDWGRYLVRAYDPTSGHSTAKVVYIDWPGWAGRSRGGNEGATMLSFSSDKPAYNIGEKAKIVIPGSGESRALVSIENGSRVINSYWVQTQKGDTPFEFEITREMTPNIFVHTTLLQPHSQTVNDLPIRLYGVIPIQVEDPETHLEPVLEMPDVLEPGQEVVIRVSEKSNRKMSYTIAMVDEGLLDLTRFKTPDPWKRFYAREALGVKTWDLYDNVMGAFGARLERLLAIGGDEEGTKEDDSKANRFKPVVKFLGPFTLDGRSDEHRFVMPQYIGSVKTMVVAGYQGAYGSTDKATPVRKPLMVLATLPRVLGPEESLKLPVTLFTMEKNIKNVKVDVKASGPLKVSQPTQNVVMSGADMTVEFDLTVLSALGVGKVEVTASSGSFKATDVIEIDVRNPNPPVTRVQEGILEAGKSLSLNVPPVGMAGTNSALLEVSSLPPINLGQRLKYLLQYPYGCIEQTTSAVFPQLYVDNIKVLTDGEKNLIQANVRAGIDRMKSFQQSDGGFAYWPGAENSDSWATTYAGHFLIEAEAKGYFVPNEMIKRWKKYQRRKAQEWRKNHEAYSSELIQAYRLYSLATAGDAELGAMNKLREQGNMPVTAAWMLAAAYAKAGQEEAARKVMNNLPTTIKPYQEMAYSYGSDHRDKAIILETLVLLKERTKAFELLKEISTALSNDNAWMSTQTVAWCLKSVGAFAGTENKGELKFNYTYNGNETEAATGLPYAQAPLKVEGVKANTLKIDSKSKGTLFVRVISEGTPARGVEEEEANNLNLSVTYTDADGGPIDPGQLEQGREFIVSVTVYNPGVRGAYKNMALNQIFPSGWEINNLRLDEAESRLKSDQPTYQDIRDDRVYTYFDLGVGQRKTFKVLLTASYAGSYYLPAVSCEAMYDHSIYARKKGQVVEVVKQKGE
jgi:alpha-2-macroglobulin